MDDDPTGDDPTGGDPTDDDPHDGYRSALPATEVERIRRWHLRAITAIRAEADGHRIVSHLGARFRVPPSVQPITGMSDLLGRAVLAEVRPDDRVLDMGTGCGANAVLAARISRSVTAVDINPDAVLAVHENAGRNGVTDRVNASRSDVFEAVDGRFDLIVFDPPYRWFRPRDALEAATTDEGYTALRRFVAGLTDHLRPGGRVLLMFATSGDLDYLLDLIARHELDAEQVATRTHTRDNEMVRYLVLRVTAPRSTA